MKPDRTLKPDIKTIANYLLCCYFFQIYKSFTEGNSTVHNDYLTLKLLFKQLFTEVIIQTTKNSKVYIMTSENCFEMHYMQDKQLTVASTLIRAALILAENVENL